MEHSHKVPAASLSDDFADDILWSIGLARSMQRSTDGSTFAVSSIWRYSALAAAAAASKSASSLAFKSVIICGMITSWPLPRWTCAIAAARNLPASNESLKLSPLPPIMAATRSISRLRTP